MKRVKVLVGQTITKTSVWAYRGLLIMVAISIGCFNFLYDWKVIKKVDALSTSKMLILWDDTDANIPAGWSKVTSLGGNSISGRFPRGETPANALQQGGNANHTPSVSSTAVSAALSFVNGGIGSGGATSSHTHTLSNASISSANNDPAYRTLKLIQYDAGIPTTFPGGGITMFDASPGAGWTRVSAQDDKMIKIDTTTTGAVGATGGSDTHTHTITWSSLGNAAGDGSSSGSGSNMATNGHTHTITGTTTTATNGTSAADCDASPGCLPPHVKPLLYKANADISVPNNLIAMFNANPGGGWAVQSNSGGIFYQQFLRPASLYDGNSSGTATHSHVAATVTTNSCGCSAATGAGTANASSSHTHVATTNFTANTDHTPEYFNVVIAKKSLPSMMLFWDGTDASIPSGWSKVNDFNGLFPRGESPGNYGDTGGSSAHSHTKSSVSLGAPSAERGTNVGGSGSSTGHTHDTSTVTVTTDAPSNSSIPRYRSLKLIKYDAGIPNTIPAGAMTIFDNSPGMPASGWTRQSAQDNLYIKVDTSVTTSSSGTHTHTATWGGSIGSGSGSITPCFLFCSANTASVAHTHTLTAGNVTSSSTDNDPPNIVPLLAKADADTATLSTGLTAMFTGDPGSGWIVQSSSGGKYYKRFLLPKATYAEPANLADLCASGFGCNYHSHTATRTTGAASGTADDNGGGAGAAAAGHTHVLTANFYPSGGDPLLNSNENHFLPPYFNVIIAEKVDFKMESYRWYDDPTPDSENVIDPWSTLDVPLSTAIPTLPTAYRPPDLVDELRLRIRILVNNNALNVGDISYKLQYKKGTDSSCSSGSSGVDWFDVGASGGGGIWRFASSSVSDGADLSAAKLSSNVLQVYAKSNPTASNPRSVPAGQTMEYDFHIQHNGAEGATQYSFRIVEDTGVTNDGTLLSEYTVCPTLVTKPQAVNQLRHGNFFESNGQEKGFSWID